MPMRRIQGDDEKALFRFTGDDHFLSGLQCDKGAFCRFKAEQIRQRLAVVAVHAFFGKERFDVVLKRDGSKGTSITDGNVDGEGDK